MTRVLDLPTIRAAMARLSELARQYPFLTGPPDPQNVGRWLETLTELEEEAKMPRGKPTKTYAVRLEPEVLDRLRELADKLSAETPGLNVTHGDAARAALIAGMEALERRHEERSAAG